MNEELVQVRQRPDPADAEEADGRAGPNPRDEPPEVIAPGQADSALLGEPLKGAGQDHARSGDEIAFSQHEMRCEIMSGPALEQGRSRRSELIEKITELQAFLPV
jgi:hypothetical protein